MDGICRDPRKPFCDVDGAVSGLDQTCIAVSCTPMDFAACRGDQAVVCNADGSNYDVVACSLGCDAASHGCRECEDDKQCGDVRPICDLGSKLCRSCRSDDECTSRVCDIDAGSCVAESAVVYASPNGFGNCALSQPCQIEQAVDTATRFGRLTIRMLPGIYQKSLDIRTVTSSPLKVVASGAMIALSSTPAIVVRDGANVVVRGVATMAEFHVACGVPGANPALLSSLLLQDASLSTLGNSSAVIGVTVCRLSIVQTDLSMNRAEIAIDTRDNATLIADRFHIRGDNNPHFRAGGVNVSAQITNSIFEDLLLDLNTTDTTEPGSSFMFAFDTFAVLSNSIDVGIGPAAHRVIYFENDIIATKGFTDAVAGTTCRFNNSLLSPQSSPRAGTLVGDPRFVDMATRNFHLSPGSPAVDAAVAFSQGLGTTHDFDGTTRPQGAKPDVGAYELVR